MPCSTRSATKKLPRAADVLNIIPNHESPPPPSRDTIHTTVPREFHSDDRVNNQKLSACRFMDLPQELREKVYEHLLCPLQDPRRWWSSDVRIRDYRLQPAILRTCKQICAEGSRVLYSKNDTFSIRLDAQAYQELAKDPHFPRFPEFCPVVKVEGGKVGGAPVLTLDLTMLPKFGGKRRQANNKWTKSKRAKGKRVQEMPAVFVGFLPALSKFCKSLSMHGAVGTLKLVVNMERPAGMTPVKHGQMMPDCFERLCEARGLGQVVILTEPQYNATAMRNASFMETRIKNFDDVIVRVCAYEAHISRKLK